MDSKVDDELLGIIKSTRLGKPIKLKGWKYVLRLSASYDGLSHIIDSGRYMPFLLSYISQEHEEEFIDLAYKCLISIASEERGALAIIQNRKDICSYLLKTISEKDKHVKYKLYLLANMSSKHEVSKIIVDIFLSSKGLLQDLMAVYSSSESSMRNQYDFLTLVFANISRLPEGRRFFLQDVDFMKNILNVMTSAESENRRIGAALILRNCCLETDYHEKLLHHYNLLPALLLPLMVPQQYESGGEMGSLPPDLQQQCLKERKGRDESASVRRVLIEALTILCYSENGWRYLKENGTYYVVRDLHKEEKDEVAKAAVEQLVAYFLVKDYEKPSVIDASVTEEMLTKQLEADFTKELPDFVLKEAH